VRVLRAGEQSLRFAVEPRANLAELSQPPAIHAVMPPSQSEPMPAFISLSYNRSLRATGSFERFLVRAACTVAAMQPVTEFQLLRYVDTTAVDLVAVCSKCKRAAVVGVMAIINAEGANVWLGNIRERQQCQHCEARTATMWLRPHLIAGS
jgi:hypothetical protein